MTTIPTTPAELANALKGDAATLIRTQTVNGEERSFAYCSNACCKAHGQFLVSWWRGSVRAHCTYEFDEVCTWCTATIPATVTVDA